MLFVVENFSSHFVTERKSQNSIIGYVLYEWTYGTCCMEQMHRECMIILKVEINLSVESNCLCSRVEGKEEEIVKWSYLHNYAEGF